MDLNSDMSFEDVCRFIKKDDASLFKKMKPLAWCATVLGSVWLASQFGEAAAVASNNPAIAGMVGVASAVGSFADLLAVRGELQEIVTGLISKIERGQGKDPLKQYRRMHAAYVMISYTAYFETIESMFPELVKQLKLRPEEKVTIWRKVSSGEDGFAIASSTQQSQLTNISPVASYADPVGNFRVSLPSPSRAFEHNVSQLRSLYVNLTSHIRYLIESISDLRRYEDENDDNPVSLTERLSSALRFLPTEATDRFYSQYLALARVCPYFYLWANLSEHLSTRLAIDDLTGLAKLYLETVKQSEKKISFGMNRVSELVKLLPERTKDSRISTLLTELKSHYDFKIRQSIFRDEQGDYDEEYTIKFPAEEAMFIPQRFKFLEYFNQRLDQDDTWRNLEEHSEVGAFILNCLSSPSSLTKPLIILGHPGSGKSTLTSILAARLATAYFTPIRVELRNVPAGHSIASQVEDAVHNTIQRRVSWAEIVDGCKKRPLLLILDGYDELLQASGMVYADYLRAVERLQEGELAAGRAPIRVIITSRMNLIQKADMPQNVTVIRLLDFDPAQIEAWIAGWNNINKNYFDKSGVQKFAIPLFNDHLMSLAAQPLLLIMLALYDSEQNSLRDEEKLSSIHLYEHLIRRFLKRQKRKEAKFLQYSHSVQTEILQQDMSALGVAALSVYNRGILAIGTDQLRLDLEFFNLNRPTQSVSGESLTYGEMLLNGFFFIVRSQSITQRTHFGSNEVLGNSVYEFLHKTFGEYLASSFMMQKIIEELDFLLDADTDPRWRAAAEVKLANLDGFSAGWYALFMYRPLIDEPVLVNMLLEQLTKTLPAESARRHKFMSALERTLYNHLCNILDGQTPPKFMMDPRGYINDKPLLGYLSVYTLNLLYLWLMISGGSVELDQTRITSTRQDPLMSWQHLTHLWRTWFTNDQIETIASELNIEHKGTNVAISVGDFWRMKATIRRTSYLHLTKNSIDAMRNDLVQMQAVSQLEGNILGLVLSWKQLLDYHDWDILRVTGSRIISSPFGNNPYFDTLGLINDIKTCLQIQFKKDYAENLMEHAVDSLTRYSPTLRGPAPAVSTGGNYLIARDLLLWSMKLAISLGVGGRLRKLVALIPAMGLTRPYLTEIEDVLIQERYLGESPAIFDIGQRLDNVDTSEFYGHGPRFAGMGDKIVDMAEYYRVHTKLLQIRKKIAETVSFSNLPLQLCLEAVECLVASGNEERSIERYAELLETYEPTKMLGLPFQIHRLILLAHHFNDLSLQCKLFDFQLNELSDNLAYKPNTWPHELVSGQMLSELIRIAYEYNVLNEGNVRRERSIVQVFFKGSFPVVFAVQYQEGIGNSFFLSPGLPSLPKISLEYLLKLANLVGTNEARALAHHIVELLK